MIATRHAVFMTAMMIGVVVGASVIVAVAAPQAAEAGSISTTRSNIKSSPIVQQEGDVVCTTQAQGQGAQQSVPNTEQTTTTGDRSDPIPDIDVKMGRNPGGSGAGAGINSEGDPSVDAALSNECSLEQNLTVEQNGGTDDSSNNVWEG